MKIEEIKINFNFKKHMPGSDNQKLDWLQKFVNHNNDDFIDINNKETIDNLKNIFIDFFWIKKIKLYVCIDLSYFPKLTHLKFQSQNLRSNDLINLSQLKHLEILDLSHNLISDFNIFNFANFNNTLKHLNLSGNRIHTINVDHNKLANIEELLLQHNCIKKINPSIHNLINLKILNLANNFLTDVEDIIKLYKLEKLYICSNFLTKLPIDMNKLQNLKILNIQRNHLNSSITLYRFLQDIDIYTDDSTSILWESDVKNKAKLINNLLIPEEYKCPICYDIMITPSVNYFGNIYCKECIVTHYQNYNTDPLFNTSNNNRNVFPIIFLEKKIKNFIETEFQKINSNSQINNDNVITISTQKSYSSSYSSIQQDEDEEINEDEELIYRNNIIDTEQEDVVSENESTYSEDLSL